MTSLLGRIMGGTRSVIPPISTLDDLGSVYSTLGYGYYSPLQGLHQTLVAQPTERAPDHFQGLATQAFGANGVVFACMSVRQLVFSSVRFTWQRLRNGSPSDTFGNPELRVLERPWPGGTTQDLLSRMIQDADLSGNSYWTRQGNELVRLRPDWVQVIGGKRTIPGRAGRPDLGSRGTGQVGWTKVGYLYTEGGPGSGADPVPFTVDEVAHFAPQPDPTGVFVGMSWLTPILREIQADQAMNRHQRAFFDNGASVNLVVKHAQGAVEDKVRKWVEEFEDKHTGPANAYKSLHLYPGADVTPVGSNLKDIDFDNVRSGGEVRIAAAAGVPPVIVGLSRGLDSATYSNYGQARRRLADGTAHPLWQNMSGSLERIMKLPGTDTRLWYDATDVPFLREDEADAANIAAVKAATIASYVTQGFTKESAVKAVDSGDINLLVDSGLTSVQLLPPGTPKPTTGETSPPSPKEEQ